MADKEQQEVPHADVMTEQYEEVTLTLADPKSISDMTCDQLADYVKQSMSFGKSAFRQIGRALIAAKTRIKLERRSWLEYLQDDIGMDERMAQHFMRLAKMPDADYLSNYPFTKALVIAGASDTPEGRKRFAVEHDAKNKSVAQLKAAANREKPKSRKGETTEGEPQSSQPATAHAVTEVSPALDARPPRSQHETDIADRATVAWDDTRKRCRTLVQDWIAQQPKADRLEFQYEYASLGRGVIDIDALLELER